MARFFLCGSQGGKEDIDVLEEMMFPITCLRSDKASSD